MNNFKQYPPGSDKARDKGCKCPIMDNYYGRGYMGGVLDEDGNIVYVTNGNCPLHGESND